MKEGVSKAPVFVYLCRPLLYLTMPIVSPCRLRSKGAYDGHSNKRSISYLTNAVYIIGATQYIYCPFLKSLVTKLTTFLVY